MLKAKEEVKKTSSADLSTNCPEEEDTAELTNPVNNNNYNRVHGAAWASKKTVPAVSVDTPRGRRKGNLQQ